MKRLINSGVVVGILLCAFGVPAGAQINVGSLRGVVTDPQGGLVVGAQVKVTETATQVIHTAVTDSQGVYTALSLPAGNYDLSVSMAGFETYTYQGVPLASGENRDLDVKLTVGAVSSHVEVTAEAAPDLETREGAYSEGEDTKTLEQLPLEINGGKRDATAYMTALPGFQNGNGFENQVNGSISGYNETYVDGTPEQINAAGHGLTRNFFSAEAVGEIKVVTTPMADLGNVGGIATAFTTKSGTNAIHGSGYGFMRNTALDATCDQFCPGGKQADHQGEYGFSVGGPVWIPHVYDGRNKSFWWFNWGHYFYNYTVASSFYGVPTSSMQAGNFASYLGGQIGTDAAGNPVYSGEVYNPATTTTVNGEILRTPFSVGGALNQIPGAAMSPIAQKYQTIFPKPTIAGNPPSNYSVSGGAGKSPDTYYQIDINQSIRAKDRLAGTYWMDNQTPSPVLQLPLYLEVASEGGPIGHFTHLSWTHMFNDNFVNVAAFGFDRNNSPILSPSQANTGAAFIGEVNPLGPCTPSFSIAGGFMTSNRGDYLCYQQEGDNNFEINDDASLVKGKHLIKFGWSGIRFNANFPLQGNLSAGFVAAETSLPSSPTCPNCASLTGNSYASFLIGAVDSAEVHGFSLSSPRIWQWGIYGQDEFKVNNKLTVTYALRYDFQPFPVENHNRVSQFEATEPNPGAGNALGAVGFLGFGPGTLNTRRVVPNRLFSTNFGPKLGFAYVVRTDTVVRGAATLSYAPTSQSEAGYANEFQQGYFPAFTTASPNGISPAFALDNGYPLPGVLYNNFNPSLANGSGTNYYGKTSDKAPRVFNTHFSIEHQFPGRMVVGLHYNGAYVHGIISGAGEPSNQLNFGTYAGYGNTCLTSDISAQQGCPSVVSAPYPGFTGTVEQALRPYPQFQDIENEGAPTATSTYTGGQLTAKKQYSNGISFLIGYTVSREFTNLGGAINNTPGYFAAPAQNAYNPHAEKAPSPADMPQQILFNYTVLLPVGRGKHYNIDNRALDTAIGGWQLSGINLYESGPPLSMTSETILFSQPQTSVVSNFLRPNVVSGQPIRTNVSCGSFNPAGGDIAAADTYLNPAAFVMPGPLQFGDAPRAFGNARACPTYNENVSLDKNFALLEKGNLKFGADFFNVFNRHIWGAPSTDVQSPNFGKIFGLANSPRSIQIHARITF